MKQFLLCFFFFGMSSLLSAQVGINNTDPKAALDISASSSPAATDGILIPRVDEYPPGVNGDQDGMLVFLTGAGAPSKGFYYWDQSATSWIPIQGIEDTDWTIVGSDIERQAGDVYIGDDASTNNKLTISGVIEDWDDPLYLLDPNAQSAVKEINYSAGSITDPSIHFDVDTDTGLFRPAQDAIGMTSNGNEKFRFTEQGQVEFYNNGLSVFLGEFAGANDDHMDRQNIAIGYRALRDNETGARNIAIGSGALLLSTGGTANVAIGDDAMIANTSGQSNIGLGIQTLFRNTIGNNNTAIGGTAMRENTEGSNNTALGFRALYNNITTNGNVAVGFDSGFTNTSGVNNTYLGTNAGHTNLGNRNVFVGNSAGYNETGSDKLYIENSNSATPLLYGEFDTNILRANGELQISNPTGTGYALPTADGTAGQLLTTDGAGASSWTTVAAGIASADNGLTETTGNIRLGGTLVETTTITHGANNFIHNNNLGGEFIVQDGGTAALIVNNNGFTGIGENATSPIYQLNVEDSRSNSYVANFENNSSGTDADGISIRNGVGSSNNRFVDFYRTSGSNVGSVRGAGGGVTYATTSDRRLKMNIKDIDQALELIKTMQPRWYRYKEFPTQEEYGFIAQELQVIYPQAVSGSPNSDVMKDPMMVDYGRLTPILTAGIKELHAKVEILETENKQLKQQLQRFEQLEARIVALEDQKN